MRFTFCLKNCFGTKEQRPRVDVKSTAPATKLCHNEISCRFLFALLNSTSKQNEWNYWKHKAETIHSTIILRFVSSVRSSNSHPDLLVTQQQQHHPLFQIHTGPQYSTFTFWATTALSKAITGLICCLHVYHMGTIGHHCKCKIAQDSARGCKMVQDGARWWNMVQGGARWCKMVQDGARWCNMVQDGAR